MHQPDEQRAPPKTMLVQVRTFLMGNRFVHMAMDMDVFDAIAVPMLMKMHAVAP